MQLELYYYDECSFCHRVLHTIEELGIRQQIVFKNVLENRDYWQELQALTGRTQVPCLKIDGKPMLESLDIQHFLVAHFG